MTLIEMELKRNGKSLLIWSVVIGGMLRSGVMQNEI